MKKCNFYLQIMNLVQNDKYFRRQIMALSEKELEKIKNRFENQNKLILKLSYVFCQ